MTHLTLVESERPSSAPIFDRKARLEARQAEIRTRYAKPEDTAAAAPTAAEPDELEEPFEPWFDRKQLWQCVGCGRMRVYGMEVPPEAMERSAKQLNCAGCKAVTEHVFSHIGRGR